MYVTAQNQDAHISMVIEDQNFMEYTLGLCGYMTQEAEQEQQT